MININIVVKNEEEAKRYFKTYPGKINFCGARYSSLYYPDVFLENECIFSFALAEFQHLVIFEE